MEMRCIIKPMYTEMDAENWIKAIKEELNPSKRRNDQGRGGGGTGKGDTQNILVTFVDLYCGDLLQFLQADIESLCRLTYVNIK